jgi:hypothetical protein
LELAGETPAATALEFRNFESSGFGLRTVASKRHSMKSIKSVAMPAALIVFVLCVYAFLLGNKVFEGKFENEAIAWYILAKGIFCSVALVALSRILDGIIAKLGG